ncbi:PAS domain S-box protein [Noviherbaspirillum sp.]|jgi:PAS domain S-box-containing protein|uniref:PAS domain S-box protein n=1 Tax=Noviherbaspirillum sp. TaxID=1926288 RepID=UPI0025E8F8F7|nr:PAS domain S-box protein [Noviherbaspirillum sp.]
MTSESAINERRLRTLSDLTKRISLGNRLDDCFGLIREALSRNQRDIPFAVLFLADAGGRLGEPAFCSGLPGAQAISIPLHAGDGNDEHPVARAVRTAEPQLFRARAICGETASCDGCAEREQALALPFLLPGQSQPRGVLVVGINPDQPFDTTYRMFLELVAAHIATAVAHAEAVGAERRKVASRTQALQTASKLLSAVFDRAPGAIAITDLDGRFVRANPAYQRLVGYGESELIGRSMQDLADPDDFTRKEALLQQLLRGERASFELEMRYLRRDGWVIWVNNFVSVIDDEQRRPRYFVKIAQDITDRKRTERELLVSRNELRVLYDRLQSVRETERAALAREVHDQLGQILSAAKIDIKLLEDDIRRRDTVLSRRKVSTELRSARGTLDKAILLVRQIATELRAVELEEQGLYAAVEWHARDFERRTRITCHVTLPADLPEPQGAAATALFRIFLEAMTNVLRHANAGQVWISVMPRGRNMLLRVRDDGSGISRQRVRSAHSIGIIGMRERAALVEGRLLLGPLRNGGTLVSARIPMGAAHDTQGGNRT